MATDPLTGIRPFEADETPLPQFDIISVPNELKQILFTDSMKELMSEQAEGRRMLSTLKKIHSSTAAELTFKSYNTLQIPFKLLSERTWDAQDSARSAESFIAISYCWRSGAWAPAKGCERFNGKDRLWPISEQMLRRIVQLRHRNEGIWIDALCIDQDNDAEQREAIAAMDLIYRSARMVIILLEDVWLSQQEEKIIEWVLEDGCDDASWEEPDPEDFPDFIPLLLAVYTKLFSARYFKRAWCSHEFQMSQDSLFLIPCYSGLIHWEPKHFDNLYNAGLNLATQADIEQLAQAQEAYAPFLSIDSAGDRRHELSKSCVKPYLSMFNDVLDLSATNRSDQISIALNVSRLPVIYLGRQKSLDECRWFLAMVALSAGDLSILSGDDDFIRLGQPPKTSWMQWKVGSTESLGYGAPNMLGQVGICDVKHESITLDLLQIRAEGNRFYPVPESCALSERMTRCFIADEEQSYMRSRTKDSVLPEEYQRLIDFANALLACSLTLGLAWMIYQGIQIDLLYGEQLHDKYNSPFTRLHHPRVHEAVTKILGWEGFTDSSIPQLYWYLYFIADFNPFPLDAYSLHARPLETALNGRRPLLALWKYGPDLEFSDELSQVHGSPPALKTSRAAITRSSLSDDNDVVYAIPVALNLPSCACLQRLWVLKRAEDGSNPAWVIRDKLIFFTHDLLEPNGESIRLLPRQRVYGRQ